MKQVLAALRGGAFLFFWVVVLAAGYGLMRRHAHQAALVESSSETEDDGAANNRVFRSDLQRAPVLTKGRLAQALSDSAPFYRFPSDLTLAVDGDRSIQAVVQYSFDPGVQEYMEQLFRSFSPDYGAFVAIDTATGRVLSMVSYSRNQKMNDNLALRATFPSASVFKVITAAAAIEEGKLSPDSLLSYNGQNHTLYRSHVLKSQHTRWTRQVTLKHAFAQSINSVFGKIGAFTVGSADMRVYADRFGFNRRIAADIPMQEGVAPIPDDPWKLAEAASGFTRETMMSPLHGALIAAAVANDGKMMEPYVVQSVHERNGGLIYSAKPVLMGAVIDPQTALSMRAMMRETVLRGTSSRSFRGFFRGNYALLSVGGKTGSLTGNDPRGKYDWFVGYADDGSRKIAIAAMTVNEKNWRVKSSYIARKAFEHYFSKARLGADIAKNESF